MTPVKAELERVALLCGKVSIGGCVRDQGSLYHTLLKGEDRLRGPLLFHQVALGSKEGKKKWVSRVEGSRLLSPILLNTVFHVLVAAHIV